jgi:hypothetical protein
MRKLMRSWVIGNMVEVREITAAMQDKELSHDPTEQSLDITPTTVKYH